MNISLTAALKKMDEGSPFQIKFVTLNRSKKTGGEILEIKKAVKVGACFNLKNNSMISVRAIDNSNHPYPVHIHLITEMNGSKIFI